MSCHEPAFRDKIEGEFERIMKTELPDSERVQEAVRKRGLSRLPHGTPLANELFDEALPGAVKIAPAGDAAPASAAGAAGATSGLCGKCGKAGATNRCGRCKQVFYCDVPCQRADWGRHKPLCQPAATAAAPATATSAPSAPAPAPAAASAAAQPPPSRQRKGAGGGERRLTWGDVRRGGGGAVRGTLEVWAQGPPFFLRHTVQAADAKGEVGTVSFYLEGGPPPGLLGVRAGSRIRWRNPHFHRFMDGQSGARIEDDDLPNLEWE
eukprot:tig00000498_g1603.t1